MTVERRSLAGNRAAVRGKESRLEEIPNTENRQPIEGREKSANEDRKPEKLSLLRQKLSQKAKQEPKFRNVSPSAKALKREREKLPEMTDHRQCFHPIPDLIDNLNRHLKGWKNYFDFGYPRVAFGKINAYVQDRLQQHLRRRSQRPFRPPEGVSYYEQIRRFGLIRL